jgi:hypothetical protein
MAIKRSGSEVEEEGTLLVPEAVSRRVERVFVILTLSIVSVILSAAMAYVLGRAFIAEPGSFLRGRTGMWLLVTGAFSFLFLPPQVAGMVGAKLPEGISVPGVTDMLSAPAGFDPVVANVIWVLTSVAACLAGAEIWRARQPGWRPGSGSNSYDRTPAGRARGLFPLQETLADVADVIARVKLDLKGVEALAPALRDVGRRLAPTMPEESSGVYRALLENGVPIPVAGPVTHYLMEGAKQGQ